MREVPCLAALVLALLARSAAVAADLRILIPLYADPQWYNPPAYVWDDVAAAGTNVPIVAIINPENGPGAGFPNADYVHGMNDLNAGGVTMLGYVYSSYGARATSVIRADIDAYSSNALIRGIFVDEVASSTNFVGYYADVYAYIHSKSNMATVVLNPGTHLAEEYVSRPAGDVAVLFENDAGWAGYVPDPYVAHYPASRFAVLSYDVATADGMRTNVDLAVQRNAGWIYVTDRAGANPWDGIPSYWQQLVEWVAAYRRVRATAIAADSQAARVSFQTLSNRPYRIESATNLLASAAWTSLTATAVSTSNVVQACDTNTSVSAKYYRLRLFP